MDLPAEHAAFTRYLRARGRRPATIATYSKAINALDAHLRSHGADPSALTLDATTLGDFFAEQLARGLSRGTVHQHHASLRAFCKYLADETGAPNPMLSLPPISVPLNPPEVLSADDLRRLLAACGGPAFRDRRDTALLSLFIDTGIRRAEMAGLTLADCDLDEQQIRVIGKGGRARFVPYGATTATRLDRYLRARRSHAAAHQPHLWLGAKGPLTAYGIEDAVARRGAQAGVAVHPHLFRHTFAHLWLDNGGNEIDLQRLAGWSSPQMLTRYGASAASARARRAYHAGRSPVDRLAARV